MLFLKEIHDSDLSKLVAKVCVPFNFLLSFLLPLIRFNFLSVILELAGNVSFVVNLKTRRMASKRAVVIS